MTRQEAAAGLRAAWPRADRAKLGPTDVVTTALREALADVFRAFGGDRVLTGAPFLADISRKGSPVAGEGRRTLTDRQVRAACNVLRWRLLEAGYSAEPSPAPAPSPQPSPAPQPAPEPARGPWPDLGQALHRAGGQGLKRPRVTFAAHEPIPGVSPGLPEAVTLRLLGPRSRTPGETAILLSDREKGYLGRIAQDGTVTLNPRGPLVDRVWDFLDEADADLPTVSAAVGKASGACVFCRKTLTDDRSLAQGYGPICASRYSLPWGGKPAPKAS